MGSWDWDDNSWFVMFYFECVGLLLHVEQMARPVKTQHIELSEPVCVSILRHAFILSRRQLSPLRTSWGGTSTWVVYRGATRTSTQYLLEQQPYRSSKLLMQIWQSMDRGNWLPPGRGPRMVQAARNLRWPETEAFGWKCDRPQQNKVLPAQNHKPPSSSKSIIALNKFNIGIRPRTSRSKNLSLEMPSSRSKANGLQPRERKSLSRKAKFSSDC